MKHRYFQVTDRKALPIDSQHATIEGGRRRLGRPLLRRRPKFVRF
jgi:hypothetical protein